MKKVNVRFKQDKKIKDIDVLFTAAAEDDEVILLMARIRDPLAGTLNVKDASGANIALPEDSVISISSDNKKLKLQTKDTVYEMKMALRDLEQQLHPSSFLRISRYEIINLRKVRKFDFSISGSLRIEMENGDETWASRRFIPEIRRRLSKKG